MVKVVIVGAGPAGIFAAINLKNKNNEVYLLDKNDSIGKKLAITGNGRCNITNIASYKDFLDNIIRNKEFMYSSFSRFDNYSLIDFLEKNNIQTIVEDQGRVFPKSMKAEDIISLFEKKLKDKGVKFLKNTRLISVSKDRDFKLITNRGELDADYLVLATGGKSYPKTGSNGDGYRIAKSLGHNITSLLPSLTPLYFTDNFDIKALNLKDICLYAKTDKSTYVERGDLLLTSHFLTGPTALKIQARTLREDIEELWIDLFPDYKESDIEDTIIKIIDKNPKKNISNAIQELVNESLGSNILKRENIALNKKANQLKKDQRKSLIKSLKKLSFTYIDNSSFTNAVITSGGIDLKEINPKTMESKLVDGLYFAGEILDVDGLTGGFNLQIAFTTGYAASLAIKERI